MDIPRSTRRRVRHLPLTPMIDVMFILIFFFMLTTNFMKIESLELLLPSSGNAIQAEKKALTRILLNNDGTLTFGQRQMEMHELPATLQTVLRESPDQRILLLTGDRVTTQALVSAMDTVYRMGGKNVFVKEMPPAIMTPAIEVR